MTVVFEYPRGIRSGSWVALVGCAVACNSGLTVEQPVDPDPVDVVEEPDVTVPDETTTDEPVAPDTAQKTVETNLPPAITAAVLSPDPGRLHQVLTCEGIDPTDPDGDAVEFVYSWRVSGVPLGHSESTIDETWFAIDDEVYCAVTPFDGTQHGNTEISNTVVILPPEHTGAFGGAPPTHSIGGTDASWGGTNYFRGNVFLNTQGGLLDNYRVYLSLASDCELDWYVHSGATDSGPWTVEFAATTTGLAGVDFMSSPPVGVVLVPGVYYGVGVAWNCNATYYGKDGGWLGYDAGIGEFQKNYWSNTYSGFNQNFTPTSTGTADLAYYHEYAITP